jgi:hypothetical protein
LAGDCKTVNIKLSSVLKQRGGSERHAYPAPIASGRTDKDKLVTLVHHSLEAKKPQLAAALEGRYSRHFRWLLSELISELDRLDTKVAELNDRLSWYMQPHTELIARLTTMPGSTVSRRGR